MRERILAPSILAADFAVLGEQIKAVEKAGAKYLHFDVMDGMFVPSISFGMPVLQSIRKLSDMVYDVHLMIEKPERYVEVFAEYGADIITVHVETIENEEVLKKIRSLGVKVGLSINPETPIERIFPYLEWIDMALVMTVHPGFGGQKYIKACTDKIRTLYNEINERALDVDIEVDGGLFSETIEEAVKAGANVIVAGSAVFNENPYESAKQLLSMLESI